MIISTTNVPLGRRRKSEFFFRDFFDMGLEESVSPFLDSRGRKISKNLPLKAALFSAFLLGLSFYLSYAFPLNPIGEVLLVAVFLIVGTPSLIDSIDDLFVKKDVNIDVLMTLAAFSAYFLGRGFEGGLLLVLFALSGSLEDLVTLKAKSALSALHSLAPTKANVIDDDGHVVEKAIEDVVVGSKIFVMAHEIVPLDGVVIAGDTEVSIAHLTGESRPIHKRVGDEVASGAQLTDGSLTIEVTHTSLNSTVSKIVELVTKAQAAKPKLERFFDRFSRGYAISIICFSFIFAISAPYFTLLPLLGTEGSIYRALAFLIAASPCALIIAVPVAYLSSLSACARKGIVLKGGIVLDALNKCSVVAFDKTGTLTLGELKLQKIESYGTASLSPDEALAIAASLERNSTHPIAKAVVLEAEVRGLLLAPAFEVKVVPGYGVEGLVSVHGKRLKSFVGGVKRILGNKAFEEAVSFSEKEGLIVACLETSDTVFLFSFQDSPRPFAFKMLSNLMSRRRVVMLTGDNQEVASKIAGLLGISEYEAGMKPEDKLVRISELSKDHGLAMVGDGVNDAPALARATVGISMGKVGSTVTQEVADVVLLNDNIELIDWLFSKAEKTHRIVAQNLLLASCAIIGASIPALCGYVPLWLAVILHEGGTVLVGLNAIRLLRN